MSLEANDARHGTINGYGNHGCRCDACRAASTAYMKEHKQGGYAKDACACGKPKRLISTKCLACYERDRAAEHGTESCYSSGCRCADCRRASAAARRDRRAANRSAARAYDRAYRARRRQAA